MLKKMILTNFLSFAENTVFDFSPSKYGILSTSNVSSTNILKGALFIGPNASGKTNCLTGIAFLLRLFKDEKINYTQYACLWGRKSYFETTYIFDVSGNEVEYTIRYNINNKALEEKLTINGSEILVRMASSGKINVGTQDILNDNLDIGTIYLRTAAFATGNFPDNPILRQLVEFITNSLYLPGEAASRFAARDIEIYAESNGFDKVNHYLKKFNYDFTLEYTHESVGEGVKFRSPDKKIVVFKRNKFPIPMPLGMESQGNLTFTCLLPHIIDTIEKPGMIIIDEFGNSLHNYLAEKTVRFFMNSADTSQLFITSHCTNLISNSVFRPDQINLISFDGRDGTKTRRLSDYKPREAQNLEKMYLSGMFEGLPDYD